mgnify:FL=1
MKNNAAMEDHWSNNPRFASTVNETNSYAQVTQEVKDAFNALCKGRVEAAVKAEREACAKVADEWVRAYEHPSKAIAETIRARGQA